MAYEVRFHLQRGKNYRYWQVKEKDKGKVWYVNPENVQLFMSDCTLVNKLNKAKKVHASGKKDVSGWISCKHLELHPPETYPMSYLEQLFYNPIKDPHWRRAGDDMEMAWDEHSCGSLVTRNNQVYLLEETCCLWEPEEQAV